MGQELYGLVCHYGSSHKDGQGRQSEEVGSVARWTDGNLAMWHIRSSAICQGEQVLDSVEEWWSGNVAECKCGVVNGWQFDRG